MLRIPKWMPAKGPPKLSPRERVLAQWRKVDPTHARPGAPPRAIGDVMPAVLGQLGLDKRRVQAEVVKVWNNLLDPTLTAHAQPTGLHKGTLFVSIDSNVWLDEIVRYRRQEILKRLQYSFGRDVITRISFRLG